VETTVYETVHHWRYSFLADAGFDDLVTRGTRDSITGERKMYWVRYDAALLDLRARAAEYPDLVHPTRYHFTQQIGARLHRESHPGFVTPSARCEGENYGGLNRNVLSSPPCLLFPEVPADPGGVVVEREAGQTWMVLA
jgi:hypothetical protein